MRMLLRSVFAVVVLLLITASSVVAQTGPWTVTFPANPSHDLVAQGQGVVDHYELQLTPQGGAALPVVNLAKPTPVAGNVVANVDAYINALPPGTYTAVVRALGPGGQAVSPASAPFSLVVPAPGAQGAPGISRSATGLRVVPKH
jgi:hypothetical protein